MTSRVIRHVIPRIQRVVMGSGFMWPALEASSMEESGVMMIPEVCISVKRDLLYRQSDLLRSKRGLQLPGANDMHSRAAVGFE
jgi:hypothetical protein